ncbi:hypothetical protein [Methylobacterium iners]|uniref:Uncharacterized protein n=1 Tax=Methylobacterium iners TaxID=418707 RepID=A0ABQ4RQP6_9HYPH|nr:hypothetical protein [Methylobacterium iners]GJD93069.1 hypothetical protein OCOJLMKI_0255 [Methylobacterium iners]
MTAPLRPAAALARAVALLTERGFSEVIREGRSESVYLKPEACSFTLRVSNHARRPRQRRTHPEVLTSLVVTDPKNPAQIEAMVEIALRNFEAARRAREG